MGIKKAKSKEVKKLTAGELGGNSAASVTLDRIYLPERTKKTQVFEGDPKTAAAQLVEKLKFEARVL
jgi:electron transfer flavoprotein beta subunit